MRSVNIAISLFLAVAVSAHAQMTYRLVSSWFENGNQMCRYDNGTVLNVGANVCPLFIQG